MREQDLRAARAVARYVRIAPQKVRIVVDQIRGKSAAEAEAVLRFTPKRAAPVVLKVLRSAIANAENNLDMARQDLYVAEAYVDEGPTLKRAHPRYRGQVFPILKRTSHITVVLKERGA
jgi:large subunit ribosomal protein L22